VGAGFSGLAAAIRLIDLARAAGRDCELVLVEAGSRSGGLVQTQRIGEYLVERGADSFITNKPGGIELCQRLGLESRLIGTDPRYRKSFIVRGGRPIETPEGFQLLAPTRFLPLLRTPLLSWPGKVRVLRERFIRRRRSQDDESLADFARRRFGQEALERIIQPLVGGIYTSDPERLSLAATLPRFVEMEREYGSVIRALRENAGPGPAASGARYGLFATLPEGLGGLLDAATSAVQAAGRLSAGEPVTGIEPISKTELTREHWQVTTPLSRSAFDAVIVSVAAYRAAELVQSWHPALASELGGIEYASSAIVVSGHREGDVAHPLDGAGLVVPHVEGRRVIAVSFASRKFPGRAPEGRVLLRTFVGGAMQPEMMRLDDDQIRDAVRRELAHLLGVSGVPDFCEVVRYDRGMPQYHVGHLSRVARIEAAVAGASGFALCGNAYRGVGIPDAVESGFAAAEKAFRDVAGVLN
jgi:oxygen-dependent protoporphyrinogen oxidase